MSEDIPKVPGRRMKGGAPQPPTMNANSSNELGKRSAPPPPQSKRTGVWGDTVFKSTTKETPSKLSPDTDEDIPVIPDLDELQEEETATQVADAPNVAVTRVATYKELDSDLFQHAAFTNIDDISLSLLTTHLHSEADVTESDVEWTWDTLFSEVMSQLSEESSPVKHAESDLNKVST